ncbi:serine-threonine-protein kinase PpkA [Salinisphaera shabanensis E1L3A]|uniref:Serine-threonine-protein kinase PpkA n=1 Tax=Salinisphaera shabanensis E1L3A TaxID=1033802 RepID=U2FPT2_9GAMM|nr:bifunctional protein-serine/threonine kinase/phosphatase [Salinisphaera shabanensis]ERJ18159.1 serine-threonine-protein kinase PpkA [Salinisphaera shabanensis E1L3A]
MSTSLAVTVGQASSAGRKPRNQDFHGLRRAQGTALQSKGIALAIADGISSSDVSHIASETAVSGFLEDYYCTSDAWSVCNAAQRVIAAINSWLYAQTRQSQYREDADRGYVCTFSAIVFKAASAYLFHVGDARIYRLRDQALERLTEDHRVQMSRYESYLARALGINNQVEIDYQRLALDVGDVFILATDGVYEYMDDATLIDTIAVHEHDLDTAAARIVDMAYEHGSHDNLTVQIVRVDSLDAQDPDDIAGRLTELAFPPALEARMTFEGYDIVRALNISGRSHVFLARDGDSGEPVALKIPASDLKADPVLLERFLLEEWIARRIDSPYVLKASPPRRKPAHVYVAMEYVEGQTLTQWMVDHPKPDMASVRPIVEQIGKGVLAFHRQEMIHQDLRPDNILIDTLGTVKIIDFGAVEVAGIRESAGRHGSDDVLGTSQYAAPEYFIGGQGTTRSDVYSLGVITYQMLTGQLPYGPNVSRARSSADLNRLSYPSAITCNADVPAWVDGALRKALHPNPIQRYAEVAEFVYDLRHPRGELVADHRLPLIDRDPNRFWKGLSALLGLAVAGLLVYIANI